jgi:hypothetical protein
MKKRYLLSVALSLAFFMPLAYASFSDVQSQHPNYDAISYVQSQQIVQGYSDGTYRPDISINRAEFTKIIIGAVYNSSVIDNCIQEKTEATNNAVFFPDVPKTAWFAKYVCTAKVNGIIQGYPDGTFKPANNINFVEAAKIIANGFKYQTSTDQPWYKPFVIALQDKNAIPTSIISFEKSITRGEMAEMIYRLKANITNKESLTYENIASGAAGASQGSQSDVNLNLMLFFGKQVENPATPSYPVYSRRCFTATSTCKSYPLYSNEWTLNTANRLAFDSVRKRVILPLAAGAFQLNFFNLDTQQTSSTGLESKYAVSYEPAAMDDTLAAAVFTTDQKETVIKYDLTTNKEISVSGFGSYEKCDWPAVSADHKVLAICKKGANYMIVQEGGTELYSSTSELQSLAADRDNDIYFVESFRAKKMGLSDKKVTSLGIPENYKVAAVTTSPFGDYIGGKAQNGNQWVIFVYKPADNSFTVQETYDLEPGIPSFGPLIFTDANSK